MNSHAVALERPSVRHDGLIAQRQHTWDRIAELHRTTVQFCRRVEEARDRAIDLSLLDDTSFEHVVDVLTAVGVNGSIAVTALGRLRVAPDLAAAGIRHDLRPPRMRKPSEPAAGDEEHHARQRMVAFRRSALLFHRQVTRANPVVAMMAADDAQFIPVLPVLAALAVNVRHAIDTIDSLPARDEHHEPVR